MAKARNTDRTNRSAYQLLKKKTWRRCRSFDELNRDIYYLFYKMEIQIDHHTLERAGERGTDENEIRDVINTGSSIPAKHGRLGKAKIFEFK